VARWPHHTSKHSKTGKTYRYLVCSQNQAGQAAKPECKHRISYTAFEASLLGLLSNSSKMQSALGQATSEPSKLAELRGKLAESDALAERYERAFETDPTQLPQDFTPHEGN